MHRIDARTAIQNALIWSHWRLIAWQHQRCKRQRQRCVDHDKPDAFGALSRPIDVLYGLYK